jgi:IS30 family transposase
MGRAKLLSMRERGKIEAYVELKLSKRDIARRIRRSAHQVTTFLQKGTKYGTNFKGRTRATSRYDERRLLRAASQSHKSSRKLKYELELTASSRTIRRRIQNSQHLRRMKMLKKPPLTKSHKPDRLNFCKRYMGWNWNSTWFTDEKKV